ncbi:DMT family transporter [Paratractidigestivibacter sp.]|uniref:DMT family transporter n=1 Tax=Paratractidigestivibacter sp. TaxID=2847316 RepID=UPI002AC9DCA2|nr:EamA family transporter [Paratractidigestivibacter sp.]
MDTKARGITMGTAGACFWGISNVMINFLTSNYTVPATWIGCFRVLIAGIVFVVICLATCRERLFAMLRDRRAMVGVALFAALGIALYQVSYIMAIGSTNASTEALLTQLSLVYVMIFTCARDRRRPLLAELAGVALALAGIYFIATKGDPAALVVGLAGLGWCLLDGVLGFLHNTLPLYALERYGSLSVNAVGMTLGGVLLIPAARPWAGAPAFDGTGWAVFAGTVICGAILGYLLAMQGLKDSGPLLGSLLLVFTPVVATVASVLLLDAAFTPYDLVGLICIVATMITMSLAKPH